MNIEMVSDKEKVIAFLNVDTTIYEQLINLNFGEYKYLQFDNAIQLNKSYAKYKFYIAAVIAQGEVMGPIGLDVLKRLQEAKFPNVPFFIITNHFDKNQVYVAIQNGITDVFKIPLTEDEIGKRINFSIKHWNTLKRVREGKKTRDFKISLEKRIFDIIVSGTALILLSPLFLIVMALLKLESRGNIFYYSLRVGSGYKIFKFYKFRSMYNNADKRLKDLKHLNQYDVSKADVTEKASGNILCDSCIKEGVSCRSQLFADGNVWCEKQYLDTRKKQGKSAFYKIKDDPRITRVGRVLRNTSIDELPQLWNVLKGDMSIVGNRPLPLYEAEKLTTDKYAPRFMAAAGITGLWQVEKRGKGDMSEEERLMLDNRYTSDHSFKKDILLILKTIPALFQKESV